MLPTYILYTLSLHYRKEAILLKSFPQKSTKMNIVTVSGTEGKLTINPETGQILARTGYVFIQEIDTKEYKKKYPHSEREDVDILDVGYWEIIEGVVSYTPPYESWREERDEMNNQ